MNIYFQKRVMIQALTLYFYLLLLLLELQEMFYLLQNWL